MNKHMISLMACAVSCGAFAQTTLASFPDPSPSAAAPDFVLYYTSLGKQVLAQWNWTGPVLLPLQLNLPLQKRTVNAFMTMPRVTVGSGGTITFTDTNNLPLMKITFDKGFFFGGNSKFGASPALGSNVTISFPRGVTYHHAHFEFTLDRGGRIAQNTYGIDAGFDCGF